MIKRQCWLSLLLLLTLCINLPAQLHENALPLSVTENLPALTHFVDVPVLDSNRLRSSENEKARQFAKMLPVDFSPENSGQWLETEKGWVWRLGIRSVNAYSLYLTLNNFHLNKDVKLFCYSPDYHHFRGAFTDKNNTATTILSIAPLEGDVIIVELNIPVGTITYGALHISKVYHDYRNEFGKQAANLRASRNICDQNINCANGKYWQTEKRAACRIISDGGLSTGTLVANTAGGMEAYVLTSHHTMPDDFHAASAIFYFNYEYDCGADVLNDGHVLAGASLLATTDKKLDFALVKLNTVPPASYQPYYAGWNAANDAPQSGVCIHHPLGGQKEIAIDYHPLTTSRYDQNYDPASAWRVATWEVGTTQPGSSGAALFDEEHRIVGTLTGGSATCYDPQNDYFSKFNMAWKNYPDAKNQLKAWLDPDNKNVTYMDGYDPYGFTLTNCDVAWNIQDQREIELRSVGLNWGWMSGHNSTGITQYAEKFSSPVSLQLPGIFLNVAKSYAAQPLSNIVVKVWEGDATPVTEKYSQLIFLKDLIPGEINAISFDSTVKLTGDFFVGYEITYENPLDSFAVYQVQNTGLTAASTMYVYNGAWGNVNNFNSVKQSASLAIGINECYGKIHKPITSTMRIHPIPASNYSIIDLPLKTVIYTVECFDSSGRQVPVSLLAEEENNRIFFNLASGIYILKVVTKEKQFYSKLIVSKD